MSSHAEVSLSHSPTTQGLKYIPNLESRNASRCILGVCHLMCPSSVTDFVLPLLVPLYAVGPTLSEFTVETADLNSRSKDMVRVGYGEPILSRILIVPSLLV
jgi:hypothetical protein